MSLLLGNEYFKNGEYHLALAEYAKIDQSHPLYEEVQLNIDYIKSVALLEYKDVNKVIELNRNKVEVISKNENIIDIENPLISIIMPVYNVAPYLDACLLSIRGQTYTNFELIVIDDASTDNAKEIIKMHAAVDSRIQFISLPYNSLGGAGIPSNVGIKLAKGEYIGFVDSDDWVDRNSFKLLVEAAVKNKADLVISDFCTFDDNQREIKPAYDKDAWKDVPLNEVITVDKFPQLLEFSPVPWRKLYKADFVRKNEIYYPEGDFFFEDNPLHWKSVTTAKSIVVIDHLMSFHRMAREGQTMSSGAFKFSALFDHMNYIRMNMPKNELNIRMLKEFIYKSRWIINRQKGDYIQNLFKKRLSQEYYKCKGKESNQTEVSNIKKFSTAFPETLLTLMIYTENTDERLQKTLESISTIKNIEYNILVVHKEIDELKLTELNEKNPKILNFSFNRSYGRGLNSLQALCSGDYGLFLLAGDTIKSELLEKNILETKKNKSDILINKNKNEQINSMIISRGFMHFYNLFFGPTDFSFFSFYWLAYIYAKKISYTDQEFVSTNLKIDTNFSYLDFLYELDNMSTKINLKESNPENLSFFVESISKKLTEIELRLDENDLNIFKKVEINFMNKLANIEKLK